MNKVEVNVLYRLAQKEKNATAMQGLAVDSGAAEVKE